MPTNTWDRKDWNYDVLLAAETLASRHRLTLRWLLEQEKRSQDFLPEVLKSEGALLQAFEGWMKSGIPFETEVDPKESLYRIRDCVHAIQLGAIEVLSRDDKKSKSEDTEDDRPTQLLLLEEAAFREGFEAALKRFPKLELKDFRIVPELLKWSPWAEESLWIARRVTRDTAEIDFGTPERFPANPESRVLFERVKAEWIRGFLSTFLPGIKMDFDSARLTEPDAKVRVKWSI
ncbi:MAG: hypothetical protein JNL01_00905 [Bdellovibrionales bacterium]|nr:hypothetical protein [Bdellovibrionales bacterium]